MNKHIISNPLQMNDWKIQKFLKTILAIQILVWIFLGLSYLDFQIVILNQLVCFIYLIFVPGILILRIIRLHELGNIKTLLYSVGLSITFLMFTGALMNTIYPTIGISNPISFVPVTLTVSILVLLLTFLSYLMDDKYSNTESIDLNKFLSPWILVLSLIPFLAIFGTYLLNYYDNNIIQMILLVIIALLLPVMLKWMPEKYLPFGIIVISITLLYHTSLITPYVWGADINREFYLSNLVLETSNWNLAIYDNYNAMLSVVMLAPIFSIFLKLNLTWIFKIIYPAIFSLVPLGLFIVYKKLTNTNIAFLACFFFMAIYVFYTVMPALARQEIAALFLVLLIMLIVFKDTSNIQSAVLLVFIGSSLIVSHYGIAYIFILMIMIAWIITLKPLSEIKQILNKNEGYINFSKISNIYYKLLKSSHKILNILSLDKSNILPDGGKTGLDSKDKDYNITNKLFLTFFIVFAITWFMYVSGSSIFDIGVGLSDSILSSITDIFNPSTSQAAYLISSSMPLFQSFERYLHLFTQLLITIGIISVLMAKNTKFNLEFKVFSIISLLISAAAIVLPYLASALNSDRIYQISLFFLAPFLIIGIFIFLDIVSALIKRFFEIKVNIDKNRALYLISAFLMVFFLLNSAFVYQIFDQPKTGRFALDNDVNFLSFNDREVSSAEWMKSFHIPKKMIFTDLNKGSPLRSKIDEVTEIGKWDIDGGALFYNCYIFVGTSNIKNNQFYIRGPLDRSEYIEDPGYSFKISKIYDNGGSYILDSGEIE